MSQKDMKNAALVDPAPQSRLFVQRVNDVRMRL